MRNTSKNWETKGTLSISFRVCGVGRKGGVALLSKWVPTTLLEKNVTLNSVL